MPASSHSSLTSRKRLAFLDWTRGLAALVMLQGHVFHSFTATAERTSPSYMLSQFVGGMTPAIFLFLTGITLAFLMDSQSRKGARPGKRIAATLKRSAYFIGIAFLFRIQLWTFAMGQSPWTDILKVDILNCMALGVALLAPLALVSTMDRIRWAALAGLGIALVSPLVSQGNWSAFHPAVQHYFVPDFNYFSFFPWAAFLAFGLAAGSIIRVTPAAHFGRMFEWVALGGIALLVAGQSFANFPYSPYAKSDFWLNGPTLVLMKLGVMCLLLAGAYLWTTHAVPGKWSWLQQLGSTSLLIYWVHIELVYGRWFGAMKETTPLASTSVMAVVVVLVMLALSMLRTGWRGFPGLVPALKEKLGWAAPMEPARVSGD
jgi:uncharacterized membrane protein